jgi:glucokinase
MGRERGAGADVNYAIGIDIGGSAVKAACVSLDGEALSTDSVSTFATDESWPHRVRERVCELEQFHRTPARMIGIAAPGIASRDERSIWWMQGRLAELQGLDWTKFLDRDAKVPVLNDAHAALLGETWKGAAVGCRNLIMLTLGTGVGGAAMVDGRLLRGHLGRAGHLGHISLDPDGPLDIVNTPGSLEEAVGDCSIERRSAKQFQSSLAMCAMMLNGDDDARRIWQRAVRVLAAGITSLINVLDPEVVILGGGIACSDALLFEPLMKELDRIEWRPHDQRVRVVRASAGEYAGALGAAYYAMRQEAGKTV